MQREGATEIAGWHCEKGDIKIAEWKSAPGAAPRWTAALYRRGGGYYLYTAKSARGKYDRRGAGAPKIPGRTEIRPLTAAEARAWAGGAGARMLGGAEEGEQLTLC